MAFFSHVQMVTIDTDEFKGEIMEFSIPKGFEIKWEIYNISPGKNVVENAKLFCLLMNSDYPKFSERVTFKVK